MEEATPTQAIEECLRYHHRVVGGIWVTLAVYERVGLWDDVDN